MIELAMIEAMAAKETLASDAEDTAPAPPKHILTEDQIRILQALDEIAASTPDGPYRSFSTISEATGLDRITVRRCARKLARYGLVEYGRGLLRYDPYYRAGSGYAITKLGHLHMSELTSRAKP